MLRHRQFIALLCVGIASSVHAQDGERLPTPRMFEKGRFLFSTAASWKNENYSLKEKASWNLEPIVGYFVRDRLAVGLGGVIGVNEFDYVEENLAIGTSTFKYEETKWGALGPALRGYIGGPRIAAFGQFGAYFGRIDQESDNNFTANGTEVRSSKKGSFQLYDLAAGLTVYIKRTVGVELMAHYYLGYAQTTTTINYANGDQVLYPRTKNNNDGGGASIGLVVMFGLQKGRQTPAN